MASKFRLTKKSAILLGIVVVILSGALGYLIWRVNQPDTTAPTDSDATSCPSGCYPNNALNICTGPVGCIQAPSSGVCPSGLDNHQGFCCDPCESTEAPASCEFRSTTFTAKEYNEQTTFPPGYYECDSAGYCIPCLPTSSEAYSDWQDCQDKADSLNGSLTTNCPAGSYKWSCQQISDGSGYKLEQIACVDNGDNGEAPVDCGTEPTSYTFNKPPTSQIGPFPEDGKVVLYYKSLLDASYRPIITFTGPSGTSYPVTMPTLDSNKRARVVTDINVKAGEYITLVSSNDNRDQGDPECAPTTNNPKYMSWGWITPSAGQCGSGLDGPPQGGTTEPMEKINVSSDITWAQSFGESIVGKGQQCWADWREWPGDYDFNDYFLQVSYEPDEIIIETNPDWDITKAATSLCLEDNTENAQSQLTYTITVKNTGDGAGTISKIEDTLDAKVLDSFVKTSTISNSGVYANGKITWTFSTPLSIAAGTTKTFTYQILVNKDGFGTYRNTVKLTPVGSDTIEANTNIVASCTIPGVVTPVVPGTNVPQTGLFDTTIGRIVGGFVLLLLGGIVYNLPNINRNNFKYRDKFEKKVANR